MALVKCKNCGHKGEVGCMPTATCGLLTVAGLAIGASLATGITSNLVKESATFVRILSWILGFIVCGVAGIFGIHYIPWTLEWVLAMCHQCPECGKRKWSFPFTEGFGL